VLIWLHLRSRIWLFTGTMISIILGLSHGPHPFSIALASIVLARCRTKTVKRICSISACPYWTRPGESMFIRPSWMPQSQQDVYDVIVRNPWGLLVSNGVNGPNVTNLPFVLDASRGEKGVLTSHLARANAHAAALQNLTEPALAVFHGPSSYVTASWYPGRDMPPTVYYTAVHCYGRLVFQDQDQLQESVEDLTMRSEADIPDGWKTTEIPVGDILRRLPAILGFELHIERMEAKFKLGQDEPKRDAMAVAEQLLQSSNPQDVALGKMVYRYNESRS
jgi:transcriptional regulator